jgi:RNA polymerase sigma factor (sigma-70 family)
MNDKTISLRATTRIRNDSLLGARESMGINQKQAAKLCGVSIDVYRKYECLRFPEFYDEKNVNKISSSMNVPSDKIFPLSLIGVKIESTIIKRREISCDKLLEYKRHQEKYVLLSPAIEAEENEDKEMLRACIEKLPFKSRRLIKLRYGIDEDCSYTLTECAKILKISTESARQRELRAIRKIEFHHRNILALRK